MYILGIGASPRRQGNSEILLDHVLQGAKGDGAKVEKVSLSELVYEPCRACGSCAAGRGCVIQDDLKRLYRKVRSADAVVIASPVYFGSITSQLKAMIDRFLPFWIEREERKGAPAKRERTGVFLCTAAAPKREYFDQSRKVVRNFFATIDARVVAELFCPGLEAKGAVLAHKAWLKKAFKIGERIGKPA